MLYGNVIFIKKSGGDGSKFPVTSTNVHIGRSDDCVIRIQNPLISPQHCQLTIENDGQARIKNLSRSNPTILNDQPLGSGKHALQQGDILKLGERFARWEYLPSSKYYHVQTESSGPLVAVVTRYQRNSEGSVAEARQFNEEATKRLNKTFTGAGRASVGKSLKIGPGSAKGKLSRRQLVLRHSLQHQKLGLSPQIKLRRSSLLESSVSGAAKLGSANTTPVRKSQKWEVKSVSPPEKGNSALKTGTNRKSTPIKMPMTHLSGDNTLKSIMRSSARVPKLLTIAELPLTNLRISSDRIDFDDVSECKNSSLSSESSLNTYKTPSKVELTSPRTSILKSGKRRALSKQLQDVQHSSDSEEITEVEGDLIKFGSPEKSTLRLSVLRKSVGGKDIMESVPLAAAEKLSGTTNGIRKSSVLRVDISTEAVSVEAPEQRKTPRKMPKSTPVKSERGKSPRNLKVSPAPTPKQVERLSRGKKSIPTGVLSTPLRKETVKGSPWNRVASSSKKARATASQKAPQNRGVKRTLSALASAERAAKKLKTIAPAKPDKNKKAALLVLGKASNKLKMSQSSNIVIKQKIVKRAIKQSAKIKKKSGTIKSSMGIKEAESPKGASTKAEKSSDSTPETSAGPTNGNTPPLGKSKRISSNNDDLKSEIGTPTQRNKKSIGHSSVTPVSESDCTEGSHGSVPSVASETKNVKTSCNSTNSELGCETPDLSYDSKRRVSKRLKSQIDVSPPEFTELSPIALGLTPKKLDVFKTPRQLGRRSYSVTTPKNKTPAGVIKSASTSKINRKMIAVSDKDSNYSYLSPENDTIFDINESQTPDVTIDLFVSPLSNKSPKLKTPCSVLKEYQDYLQVKEEESGSVKGSRSPTSDQNSDKEKSLAKNTKSTGNLGLMSAKPLKKSPRLQKSPKNDLTDVRGVRRLMESAGRHKSPKNDLTDVRGVRRLMESAGRRKSPKNDLTDVRGVRRLMESAGRRKSPRNDLTDVRGVRRLMESAGRRKSPRNDLTDVRGVRRLFEPPKSQKSPKNDLTDVRGVRKLMELPKKRESPRNDLTDVTGVKQLFLAKSPENDLSNISGLDRLFESPPNKIQLRTLNESGLQNIDHTLSDVFSKSKIYNLKNDFAETTELCRPLKKTETPRRRTRNTNVVSPEEEGSGQRPLLQRVTKTASKIVKGSDESKIAKKPETPTDVFTQNASPKVKRGRKTDIKDNIEESVSVRTRSRSEREVKLVEVTRKTRKNSNTEEVITGRSTRASSKADVRKQAVKRQVPLSKSPTPVKRTRKGVTEKIEEPTTVAGGSKTKKETAVTTSESKPSPIRTRRKSVARQSPKIVKKSTRVKANESVPEASRSLRQKSKTQTAKDRATVSPVKTRQRKAKTTSPAKTNELKSSPVKTRRKAK